MKKRKFFYLLGALLIFLFYKEIIFKEKYLWDDILYQWYPFLTYLKESVKNFKLPTWNPYVFSGMPFLNDIQSQVFYPLNYLFLFLNGFSPLSYYQVELIVLFHIFLIFLFTFILLKSLKIDEKIAFLSSLFLTFSSFVTLRTIQLGPLAVFTYFPIVTYFFFKFLKENKISKNAIYGGIIFGLSFFAGYPQFSLFLIYNLLLYFIFFIIINKKFNRFQFINLFLFFLIGLGIVMVQFYPSYKYLPFTVRKKLTFEEASDGSLSFLQLINIFIPKFFGSVSGEGSDTIFYWLYPYGHYYWEAGIYLGILPFFLSLYGLIYSKRKEKYLFFIPAIFGLFFAFGKNFFLYNLFFNILPGLKQFRFPSRFLSIYTFNMIILSALGIEVFLKERKNFYKFLSIFFILSIILFLSFKEKIPKEFYRNCEKQFLIYSLFLILAIFTFFYKTKKVNSYLVIIGLISYFDLFLFGSKFSKSPISDEDYYPNTTLVRELQKEREKEFFRINSREDSYMILKRNEGCLWKLELLEGYTPLNLHNFSTFHIKKDRKNEILNVKYEIKVDKEKMELKKREKYLERIRLYYDYVVISEDKEILKVLDSDTFDIYEKVILKKNIPNFNPLKEKNKVENSLKILKYEIDEILLEVTTNYPGILLLSEIYYPEWEVKVDNKKEEIYEADYLLRAVPIKEGKHLIKFYYSKKNILIGLFLTLITLIFSIALLVFLSKKDKN